MHKRYKLLKDWLHNHTTNRSGCIYPSGTELRQIENDDYYRIQPDGVFVPASIVENNPDFFELLPEPYIQEKERVEVTDISFYQKGGSKTIMASLSSCILDDQLPAIKEAIESVLNSPEPKHTPVDKIEGKGADWEIVKIKTDGLITLNKGEGYFDSFIRTRSCEILSVKRLSDGLVFSIGDEVEFDGWVGGIDGTEITMDGKIDSIVISPTDKNEVLFNIHHHKDTPSGKYIKNIRKKVAEDKPVLFTTEAEKPPLGVMPEWLWKEKRFKEIDEAIKRYTEAKKSVPLDWVIEYSVLAQELDDKKKGRCNTCGDSLVEIRGKYPNNPERKICPTCTTERLESINEMSSKDYGKTCQEIKK